MSDHDNFTIRKHESPVSQEHERLVPKWLRAAVPLTAMLMIAYHLWSIWFPVFSPLLHQNIHLSFAFVLIFFAAVQRSNSRFRTLYVSGAVLSLIVTIYIHANAERLDMWSGYPENVDVVVGLVLVGLVVFLTLKIWGSVFPILLGISILYALFGHHIPGALGHAHIGPKLVLSNLGIGLKGIYGMMLNASANLIFLFIIFGSVFEAVGIDKFFLEIGYFLGRHLRGGAAQTAVFSSSLVGMCTGAAAANVALTGSYTIPLMKQTGFHPKHAGAIEAVASTGGQLTPPVMGVAIFLMASFLGVNYGQLMLNALVPAIVFYAVVILGVLLIASREKIPMLRQPINRNLIRRSAPLFVLPMGLVTVLLIKRYTPAYAAALALLVLLVVSLMQKETRPSIRDLIAGFAKGAVMASGIALACACIGMFMTMLTTTGAGPKFAGVIQILAGENLVIALILTMVLSIFLGCAMPTVVAYVITALVVSPALVDMGLDLLSAHFFVFYFAILSAVTPPVAGATVVGSQIAGYSYMKTGWESLKLTGPFFLVPYFIIRNPVLFAKNQPFIEAFPALVSLAVACGAFLVFCQGYCFNKTGKLERILFLISSVLAAYYGLYNDIFAFVTSLLLFLLLLFLQFSRRKTNDNQ